MYEIHLSNRADKFLEKLDAHIAQRIIERLKKLSKEPVPTDSKFISREGIDKIYRYRIGDFRALYKLKVREKIVLIARIDKRPRIYHR